MATLLKNCRTGGFTIQWSENKHRKSISLSKQFRQKTAEMVKEMIETLLYYRCNGIHIPDNATARRLEHISPVVQEKLAQAGLIAVTKAKTCRDMWTSFLRIRDKTVKDKTLQCYFLAEKRFFKTFSLDEPIGTITAERLLEWKSALLKEIMPTTVAGQLNVTRMAFEHVVEIGWLPKNPMRKISIGSFVNTENNRPVSMAEYGKLLDACPDYEWRTIISLVRIGGLRCPSELQRLRWADINWAENRFLVHSPKTERYERHRQRIYHYFRCYGQS